MTYFKINDIDFSMYVNRLKVGTQHTFKSRVNASGNMSVKYTNTKKIVEVGIIPLDSASAASLQKEVNKFKVKISFLEPETKALKEVNCIIPDNAVEYYTIQADKVMLKAYALTFTEL